MMTSCFKLMLAVTTTLIIVACNGPGTPATAPQQEKATQVVMSPEAPVTTPTEVAVETPTTAPTEVSTVTPEPASTADKAVGAAPGGEFILAPGQISLDTQDLPVAWRAIVAAGTPYDQSRPPGPIGLPTHIEILFGQNTDPAEVRPGDPIMYIIPVNSYRKLWDDAGNPSVTRTIDQIQQLNFVLPVPGPTSGYPALPFEQIGSGFNDLAVQVSRAVPQNELNTTSATQDGYRFAGRWAQDANPVTNLGLRYVYQGFTNDGVYLVSFWWPVTTPVLPDDVGGVPTEQMDRFDADPVAAIDAVAQELNSLSADQWQPDLKTLDALVASLEIEGGRLHHRRGHVCAQQRRHDRGDVGRAGHANRGGLRTGLAGGRVYQQPGSRSGLRGLGRWQ
jgi:hypothetical protein